MKKLIFLLLVVFGLAAVFVSCDDKEPEIRAPKGTVWRETHRYFDGRPYLENDELFVQKYSIDVPEEDAYEITLFEDGSGWGSGPDPGGYVPAHWRYEFDFTWTISEDKFTLNTTSPSNARPYNGMYFMFDGAKEVGQYIPSGVPWDIEEYTDDKLVISIQGERHYDGDDFGFDLSVVHRITFEKVK